MKHINTTWIAGTPRTGSMVTFNITREIFRQNNVKVLPEYVFKNDDDSARMYQNEVLSDVDELTKYVFKVHERLSINLPRSKYIVNVRNPFDICASFYEFMKCDLKKAIEVAKTHLQTIEHYQKCDKKYVFFIRYEELEAETYLLIMELARFLGYNLSNRVAEEIQYKFSKTAVNEIINETSKNVKKHSFYDNVDPENTVAALDGKYRIFDKKTGFQTGHISKRNTGEWTKAFEDKQIAIIISELAHIAQALGYEGCT